MLNRRAGPGMVVVAIVLALFGCIGCMTAAIVLESTLNYRMDPAGDLLAPSVAMTVGIILAGLANIALGWIGDRARGRLRCPSCWYDMQGVIGQPTASVDRTGSAGSDQGTEDERTPRPEAKQQSSGEALGSSATEAIAVCPECGRRITSQHELSRTRRRRWQIAVGVVLILLSHAGYLGVEMARRGALAATPTWLLIIAAPHLPDHWFDDPTPDANDDYDGLLDRVVNERYWIAHRPLLRWQVRALLSSTSLDRAGRGVRLLGAVPSPILPDADRSKLLTTTATRLATRVGQSQSPLERNELCAILGDVWLSVETSDWSSAPVDEAVFERLHALLDAGEDVSQAFCVLAVIRLNQEPEAGIERKILDRLLASDTNQLLSRTQARAGGRRAMVIFDLARLSQTFANAALEDVLREDLPTGSRHILTIAAMTSAQRDDRWTSTALKLLADPLPTIRLDAARIVSHALRYADLPGSSQLLDALLAAAATDLGIARLVVGGADIYAIATGNGSTELAILRHESILASLLASEDGEYRDAAAWFLNAMVTQTLDPADRAIVDKLLPPESRLEADGDR